MRRIGIVLSLVIVVTVAAAWSGNQTEGPAKKNGGPPPKKQTAGKKPAQTKRFAFDITSWPAENTITVQLFFGLTDTEPTDWSGSVAAEQAKIVRVRPWRFGADMQISPTAPSTWKCGTWQGPMPVTRPFDVHLPEQPRPFVRPAVLVDLQCEAGAQPRLEVVTPQGNFTVDVSQLERADSAVFLNGRVRASLAVFSTPVAVRESAGNNADDQRPERTWHDYPSIAVHPSRDEVAVAFQAYSQDAGGDRAQVRRRSNGKWQAAETISERVGDVYRTAIAYDSRGQLWAVFATQVKGNWDLYGRQLMDGRWQKLFRLTDDPQPDMHHILVRDRAGALWLVWQGFRKGQSDILARRWDGMAWSETVQVSKSPANDWQPAAAACGGRGIVVAWDTYDAGNYDVCLRSVGCRSVPHAPLEGRHAAREEDLDATSLGREIVVADSPLLEARATVAVDAAGRAWVAYDLAGPNWGKDTGFQLELAQAPQGTRLYESRMLGMMVVDLDSGERYSVPAAKLPLASLNVSMHEHLECPQLVCDDAGRMWLAARRRSMLSMGRRGVGRQYGWELLVSRFDPAAATWTEPLLAADSIGRLDVISGIALGKDTLWLAWPTDHRTLAVDHPDMSTVVAGRLRLGPIPPGDAAQSKFARCEAPAAAAKPDPTHAHEAADVAQVRGHKIESAGKTYHIYRGDMHRHTEHSSDGGSDGTLLDAYRYALDAAAMDFLLVTDHNDGNREYDWWRREKYNDLFNIGESFAGLCGYERSVSYPQGHRNVFIPQRGARPLDISPQEQAKAGGIDTGPVLYPYLRKYGGICFSHTSATSMGTDWRDNDPLLEPLVEIFQGDRTNYEKLGAPWSADSSNPGTQEGGFQPLGYVNLAFAKGYKLGFQASSDHLSTHLSYSCILAERNTREALFSAMQERHAYAATDNILLDVRSTGAEGEHLMGDAFTAVGPPQLRVKIAGTAKLAEVVVVKDDKVVYSNHPATAEFQFTFTDMEAKPGKESYYYIRAMQANRQLAWASPMWIRVGK